ncbi:Vps52; component of GARP (Golgi-associated retrograde protein) and EARP (endosome-associated recycling protein) complexes [Paratrimastix pyriformis]|uniref:Vps52 n=1 Tax=Paratrimastix pyriformis TaxID=342808 RepID=A0ABQ8UE80_9EUKA|nr:Vps52; component of GARP (Golgi-associated retrograde protein) and EARP (endosome-associated recycling protein) complexes [Paratrimastix pyriformis]
MTDPPDSLLLPDIADDLAALLDPNLPPEIGSILKGPKLTSSDFQKRIRIYEQDLHDVESESVDDYVKEAENFATLHTQIGSCDSVLERMEELLTRFQVCMPSPVILTQSAALKDDLGRISSEIRTLQDNSISMNVQLKNRKDLYERLSGCLSDLCLSEEERAHLLTGPRSCCPDDPAAASTEFVAHLHSLHDRWVHANDPKWAQTRAARDAVPILKDLIAAATTHCTQHLVALIGSLRHTDSVVAGQVRQSLMRCKDMHWFLRTFDPAAANAIEQTYCETMSKAYLAHLRAYATNLQRVLAEGPSKSDLIAVAEGSRKSIFGKVAASRPQTYELGHRLDLITQLQAALGPILATLPTSPRSALPPSCLADIDCWGLTGSGHGSKQMGKRTPPHGASHAPCQLLGPACESGPWSCLARPAVPALQNPPHVRVHRASIAPPMPAPVAVQAAEKAKERYPYEMIFYSMHRYLTDAALTEHVALSGFFGSAAKGPVIFRPITEVYSTSWADPNRYIPVLIVIPLGLIQTSWTDTNLLCCLYRPEQPGPEALLPSPHSHHHPVSIARASPCSQSLVTGAVNESHDMLGLLLVARLVSLLQGSLHARQVDALDGYFAELDMLLWPRFKLITQAHANSLQTVPRTRVYEKAPHYVVRRYAQLVASVAMLNTDSLQQNFVCANMRQLRADVGRFITSLAQEFQSNPLLSTTFLINNYYHIVATLAAAPIPEGVPECEDSVTLRAQLSRHIASFVDTVLRTHFSRLVQSVPSTGFTPEDIALVRAAGDDSTVETIVREFGQIYRAAVEQINEQVMECFADFKNGTEIFRQVLTQLVVIYTRFSEILDQCYKDRPFRHNAVPVQNVMFEIRRHSRSFDD